MVFTCSVFMEYLNYLYLCRLIKIQYVLESVFATKSYVLERSCDQTFNNSETFFSLENDQR